MITARDTMIEDFPGLQQNVRVALLAGPHAPTNTYHVVAGALPEELTVEERDSVIQPIRLWEAQPLSRPN
jgi:hypothetical protein